MQMTVHVDYEYGTYARMHISKCITCIVAAYCLCMVDILANIGSETMLAYH